MSKAELTKMMSTVLAVMDLEENGTDKEKVMSKELLSDPTKLLKFYNIAVK